LRLLKIKTRREINLKISDSCLDFGVHYTGPNCLYESLVHFGVEDDKAKDLAYEPVTEFVASFEA